jgi:uncharacterized protein (TIGR00299 family) protein
MTIAQLDCFAGVTGGMLTSAWLDTGVDEDEWRGILSGIAVDGYQIYIDRVSQNGIRATRVAVEIGGEEQPYRTFLDLVHVLEESQLPQPIREKSENTLFCLADAERLVHGSNDTYFQSGEAIETLIHIVGTFTAWYLAGMPTCYVSEIAVGSGVTDSKYGVMPVPTPVTIQLLTGFVTRYMGAWGEIVSSAGAAILRTLCESGRAPSLIVNKIGYGAGGRDFGIPDVLRIQLGEKIGVESNDDDPRRYQVAAGPFIVETNIDDMNPEWAGYIIPRLLDVGASDAYIVPIIMKKGRPGIQLRVLCRSDCLEDVKNEIFRQTSSIGLRYYEIQKEALSRKFERVQTPYGEVSVKIAFRGEHVFNVAPEYEDCRLRAEECGVPLKQVYQSALLAAASLSHEQ